MNKNPLIPVYKLLTAPVTVDPIELISADPILLFYDNY